MPMVIEYLLGPIKWLNGTFLNCFGSVHGLDYSEPELNLAEPEPEVQFEVWPKCWTKPKVQFCNNHYIHMTYYCNSTQSHPSLLMSWSNLVNHMTFPGHIPKPLCTPMYPWSWYTMLHSCGILQLTHIPAFVHSPHTEIYSLLYLPYIISTLILCPHAFPSLYVPLHMPYAHFPGCTLNIPNIIMRPDLIHLSI